MQLECWLKMFRETLIAAMNIGLNASALHAPVKITLRPFVLDVTMNLMTIVCTFRVMMSLTDVHPSTIYLTIAPKPVSMTTRRTSKYCTNKGSQQM
jgi:hypothetical protein